MFDILHNFNFFFGIKNPPGNEETAFHLNFPTGTCFKVSRRRWWFLIYEVSVFLNVNRVRRIRNLKKGSCFFKILIAIFEGLITAFVANVAID